MTKRLIVIGGVAAGMSAAAKAKRVNPHLEAIVYEKGPHISYAACGMPYYIAGDVPDYRSLFARTPEQMAQQGVRVHLHHEVVTIDPSSQTVTVRDLENEREFSSEYSQLVIATGARPARPSLPGADLEGVFVLRSLLEGLALKDFIATRQPRRALIIGGGYVGVEMAETFRRLGLEVSMLIRSGHVMRTALDNGIRAVLVGELERHGVELFRGEAISLEGERRVEAVVTNDSSIPCDLVLVGVGARPETELACAAGVALGQTGAIATDGHMRTNVPNVLAAGDCAEAYNLVPERQDYMPLGSTANKQGRVAGTNAAGGEASFRGIVGTMVARAFDLTVARTGLTYAQAEADGRDARTTTIKDRDSSRYFPGSAELHVSLVVENGTDRLLGGQIVGRKGVAKRIDVLATALHHRFTVQDLQQLDLSYAPPFAPVWDPILVAANVAARG
jgi:NADPH-dependent 2,4-dienoyl-CoA reductase/sulfur reductase-like enzyme